MVSESGSHVHAAVTTCSGEQVLSNALSSAQFLFSCCLPAAATENFSILPIKLCTSLKVQPFRTNWRPVLSAGLRAAERAFVFSVPVRETHCDVVSKLTENENDVSCLL
jgi:hypothetical protein